MNRKRLFRLAIAAVVVVGVVIGVKALTAPGAPAGMPQHISIAQAIADSSGLVVKVGGDIAPGSVNWDDASRSLRFTLTGNGDRLPVVYPGRAPKDFRPGQAMVVEGVYSGGVFRATELVSQTSPLCKACHG